MRYNLFQFYSDRIFRRNCWHFTDEQIQHTSYNNKMKNTLVFFVFLYISFGILDGTPACPGICTGNSACPSGKYFSLFKLSLGNFLKLKMPMYISKVSYALKEAYPRVCLDAQKVLMLTNHMELLLMRTWCKTISELFTIENFCEIYLTYFIDRFVVRYHAVC